MFSPSGVPSVRLLSFIDTNTGASLTLEMVTEKLKNASNPLRLAFMVTFSLSVENRSGIGVIISLSSMVFAGEPLLSILTERLSELYSLPQLTLVQFTPGVSPILYEIIPAVSLMNIFLYNVVLNGVPSSISSTFLNVILAKLVEFIDIASARTVTVMVSDFQLVDKSLTLNLTRYTPGSSKVNV